MFDVLKPDDFTKEPPESWDDIKLLDFEDSSFFMLVKKHFKGDIEKDGLVMFYERAAELNLFPKHLNELVELAVNLLAFDKREFGQSKLFAEVIKGDLRLLLGIPFRNRLETIEYSRFKSELAALGPRAFEAEILFYGFIIPLLKGRQVPSPVLLGPPATGKSFIPQEIVKILNRMGFKAELVFINAGVEKGKNDEIDMKLLGIDAHWGNAGPGEIYRFSKADLVLVVLDEVDKRSDRRFLLELFDSGLPLKDRFFSPFAPKMNLRPKVAFIGTANEITWEDDAPFSSRIISIPIKPYSLEERLFLVKKLIEPDLSGLASEVAEMITKEIFIELERETDVRKALGLAKSMVELVKVLPLEKAKKAIRILCLSKRENRRLKKIGF